MYMKTLYCCFFIKSSENLIPSKTKNDICVTVVIRLR